VISLSVAFWLLHNVKSMWVPAPFKSHHRGHRALQIVSISLRNVAHISLRPSVSSTIFTLVSRAIAEGPGEYRMAPARLIEGAREMRKRPSSKASEILATTDGERLLPIRAVQALTSWSRTSIYRLMDEGQFPQAIQLGKNRIAFRETDIRAYIASRQPRPSDQAAG
jgi:prophage regulatory protein